MIIEDAEVAQRIHGPALHPFRKEVVRLLGEPPRFMVRKRTLSPEAPLRRHPVLLLHGFGQNRRAWHLSGRSFANHLAAEGFDVFNTELRGHGRSRRAGAPPPRSLDESVDVDLPAALDTVAALSGHARVFLVGHSLGGLISYAVAAARPSRVAGVVTLGAPYRFGAGNPTLALARRAMVSAAAVVGAHRPFPMALVRAGFRGTAPAWDLPWLPLPLRAWAPGAFEPSLRDEYLREAFDVGTLGQLAHVAARAREFERAWSLCEVPALVIAGEHDLLAPPASVHPAFVEGLGRHRTWATLPFGHGDLILGRDAPAQVWPLVTRWLIARDGETPG